MRAFAVNDLNTNGAFTFSGQGGTGSAMADFIYGRPVTFTQLAPIDSSQRQVIFGLYLQDTWKLNRRLTVNRGCSLGSVPIARGSLMAMRTGLT